MFLAACCVYASLASPEGSAAEELGEWYARWSARRATEQLFLESDLAALGWRMGVPGDRDELSKITDALDARYRAGPEELRASSPQELVRRILRSHVLQESDHATRFENYALLLDRFERAAHSRDPEACRLLVRIAGHDLDRTYSRKEWKRVERFRPHLVRREARNALLRADPEVAIPVLLEPFALERVPAPELLRTCSELIPPFSAFHDTGEYLRFQAAQVCWTALFHHEDPVARRGAAAALAGMRSGARPIDLTARQLDRLLDRLGDEEDDEALVAALPLLRTAPGERVLERLARLLAEREPPSQQVHEALHSTLLAIGPVPVDGLKDRRAWLAWYEAERDSEEFRAWSEQHRDENGNASAPPARAYAAPPRFYGVPVTGRRVVFVIDHSGSMNGLVGGTSGTSKLDTAKKELATAIEGLDERTRFQIIFFSSGVQRLQDRLVPASRRERDRALRAVKKVKAGGGTDLYGALMAALRMRRVGQSLLDVPFDERPDQIILLSDGVGTTGEIVDRRDLIDEVARYNLQDRIRIDTVALGLDADRDFLEGLARLNGGVTRTVGTGSGG